MIGKIHSIETMGLLDGPGIRFVVFMQGCSLRCIYCHNPDTWDYRGGYNLEATNLLEKALRYKAFFTSSGGGVTCSGGEPLMQPEFIKQFFKLCKEKGIHTTLDTAGFGKGNYGDILKFTDLVILDLKHTNNAGYLQLTGNSMDKFSRFIKALKEAKTKVWLRHVVIPGLTDSLKHLREVKEMIDDFPNVEKVELLPYHTLGESKYQEMGLKYKLEGLEPMDKELSKKLEKEIFNKYKF